MEFADAVASRDSRTVIEFLGKPSAQQLMLWIKRAALEASLYGRAFGLGIITAQTTVEALFPPFVKLARSTAVASKVGTSGKRQCFRVVLLFGFGGKRVYSPIGFGGKVVL